MSSSVIDIHEQRRRRNALRYRRVEYWPWAFVQNNLFSGLWYEDFTNPRPHFRALWYENFNNTAPSFMSSFTESFDAANVTVRYLKNTGGDLTTYILTVEQFTDGAYNNIIVNTKDVPTTLMIYGQRNHRFTAPSTINDGFRTWNIQGSTQQELTAVITDTTVTFTYV